MRALAAFAFGIVVALASQGGRVSAGPWTDAKSKRVDEIVAKYLEDSDAERRPPSLSIGVGVGGDLVVAKGWGDVRDGVAADSRTLYQIGSLTKQFTAAAVLKLIDQGRSGNAQGFRPLTLDRPLRELFDGVSSWEQPNAPPLTVRSLLTMTSNLPNFTKEPPPQSDPWGAMPASRLLSEVKKLTPKAWPNSFSYSNTSYFLLSEIIEMQVAPAEGPDGESRYHDFLRSEIFRPAGMRDTGFTGDAFASQNVAEPNFHRHVGFGKPDWFKGSGDMVSSVADLFAWDKALMDDGVLAHALRDQMFAPQAPIGPSLAYGMGFYVERAPGMLIYSHSGTVPGFTAFNAIIVENEKPGWISVTVLTNSDGVKDLQRLADQLAVVALE